MVEILALIPARGGSKGIPRKNIKNLAGYPLIAYSIAAGVQSSLVTRTIVSTDDQEIAQTAREFGADVPFLRPREFAQDQSRDLPVFQHALTWLEENESYRPEIVVQLRPTSPFRPVSLVDEAVRILLDQPRAASVRGVVPSKQNPYKMWTINDSYLKPLIDTEIPEPYNQPRQALPTVYWQSGYIDVIRRETILDKESMTGDKILPYVLEQRFVVDIDHSFSLKIAEMLLKNDLY